MVRDSFGKERTAAETGVLQTLACLFEPTGGCHVGTNETIFPLLQDYILEQGKTLTTNSGMPESELAYTFRLDKSHVHLVDSEGQNSRHAIGSQPAVGGWVRFRMQTKFT